MFLAINKIQKERFIDIVVFGHMHNVLKRNLGLREMLIFDKKGTAYLNTAIVPRYKKNSLGKLIVNFSWVEFQDRTLSFVSQRWYTEMGEIEMENVLFSSKI